MSNSFPAYTKEILIKFGNGIFLYKFSNEQEALNYMKKILSIERDNLCTNQPKENQMSDVANEAAQVIETVAPESIAAQAVEATVTTVADPSVFNIVADLELAHTLYNEFKAKISNLHPTVANIFKALF